MAHGDQELRTVPNAAELFLLMSVVSGVAGASTGSGSHCGLDEHR